MTRTLLLTGTLLAALTTAAFAQSPQGQYQGNANDQGGHENFSQRGPMWHHGGDHGWGGPWDFMHHGHEHAEAIMRIAGALASGTFYRIRRGPDEVDVHCPPSQSLQDCVNGASQLMRTLQQTGSPPPPGGPPPAAPAH